METNSSSGISANRALDTLEDQIDEISRSDLFSAAWYLASYPDVAVSRMDPARHFLMHGAGEGRDPGPFFSTQAYLRAVPNLSPPDQNPLLHYLRSRDVVAASLVARRNVQKKWRDGVPYRNFAQYLRWSLLDGVMHAPFSEADKRCLAQMEMITQWLSAHARGMANDGRLMVSVVMPVRNRAGIVATAIQSILVQTFANFEVVVVDDGSTDNTLDVLRTIVDARVRILASPNAKGVSAARNQGLDAARGEWIAYLDSDNVWEPDYLCAMVGAILHCHDADALYSAQYLYQQGLALPDSVRFVAYNKTLLRNRNYIDLNCFVHRRSLLPQMEDWFDTGLKRLVDWDFIRKIAERFEIRSVPFLQSVYIEGLDGQNITQSEDLHVATERVQQNARDREASRKAVAPLESATSLEVPVAVVIASFEAIESLRACVESVRRERSSTENLEVIVIDNNSGEEVFNFLAALRADGILPLFNFENYGFSYAINRGVDFADAKSDILILNNDAVLPPGAIRSLQQLAYQSPSVGIVVPAQMLPAGSSEIGVHVPSANQSTEADVNLSMHHDNIESVDLFHHGRVVDLNFAPFFCAYIKRDVWDACGGLDHEHGRHHRSDRIMCDFVRNVLKKRVVYTPDVRVCHEGQTSSRQLREKDPAQSVARDMLQRNQWPPALRQELGFRAKRWNE
jgi:glycosyltransferase involved in cell wall biosynthesis